MAVYCCQVGCWSGADQAILRAIHRAILSTILPWTEHPFPGSRRGNKLRKSAACGTIGEEWIPDGGEGVTGVCRTCAVLFGVAAGTDGTTDGAAEKPPLGSALPPGLGTASAARSIHAHRSVRRRRGSARIGQYRTAKPAKAAIHAHAARCSIQICPGNPPAANRTVTARIKAM